MIRTLLDHISFGPLHTVRQFQKNPISTQTNLLRNLLRRAALTEWGRRFDFADLAKEKHLAEAFRNRVPIHTYDDIRADVERIRAGATDVLWPGRFKYVAASSGTTSTGRIIPVSKAMLRKDRDFGLAAALNYVTQTGHTGIFTGKHLTLPGWTENDRQPGTRIAQISALLTEYASATTWLWRAVPLELGFIPNWEQKMTTIARHVMHQDIRLIAIAPSWAQVLFREIIKQYNGNHLGSIQTIGECWPNLQVVITGGVALGSYRDILSHQIGLPQVDFVETYGASEGFFSFQNDLQDPAMLLHLDAGVYLEYVRLEELNLDQPQRYHIGEVEVGIRYAPIVTTNSGLWAYLIGDVIRFTQTNPHKIVVVGRTTEMLDKYGECVFGEEARLALRRACKETGTRVLEYQVTHTSPHVDRIPAHQWLIEFETQPTDLPAFVAALDHQLKAAGHHYEDRREGGAFDRPEVVALPPGSFYRWMHTAGKRIGVQTKVPRMMEEREMADGVLRMLQSENEPPAISG